MPHASDLGPCLPQASGQRNNWGEGASLRRGGQGGEPLSQEGTLWLVPASLPWSAAPVPGQLTHLGPCVPKRNNNGTSSSLTQPLPSQTLRLPKLLWRPE